MLIKSVTLENFRSYKDPVIVELDKLTTFIGKNDIGKSTILEALDIFFNEGNGIIKIDKEDLNKDAKGNNETEIVITVQFEDLPKEIIIDDSNKTSLKDEYLLDSNDCLTIVKKYNNGGKPKVFIKANHPINPKCNNLLSLKQKDLQKEVDSLRLNCDKVKNAEMRKAIWDYYSKSLNLQEQDIESGIEGLKDIFSKLNQYFPLYSLFQSDRSNSDKDREAQDPMKEAVKIIMGTPEIKEECNKIASKVTEELQKVTKATLDKLQEMNSEIASSLKANIPPIEELKWTDVFKTVSLSDNSGILLNKKGSGVKRLVLLNFFRAEAEKIREERKHPSVIYAIEEPETSQHIRHQEMLINSLKELSKNENIQILLTTHSSFVVKQVGFENLRLIENDDKSGKKVNKVFPLILPYPSLSEINFVAFGDYSEGYHNELYGYLQETKAEKELDDWFVQNNIQRTKEWKRDENRKMDTTLPTYIRNAIHHPENKINDPFTRDEIKKSIDIMRQMVSKALDINQKK
jgi:predicted ATP-dependent endonuclease of OLD family